MRSRLGTTSLALVGAALALAACRGDGYNFDGGSIDFDPDRPGFDEPEPIEPYDGENAYVLEAQSNFPTGIEFHQKVVWRTCTPNEGVCHNAKEYPDLRTPASFASSFNAACNVQAGEHQSIYDGCEQPGDRVQLGGAFDTSEIELGWIEYVPGENNDGYDEVPAPDAAGLHIHLRQSLTTDRTDAYARADFSRSFVIDNEVQQSTFESYSTRWWVVDPGNPLLDPPTGAHLIGEVRNYQTSQAEALSTIGTLVQGDGNRNGIFGAEESEPASLLVPGWPESSYLIARMRGHMGGDEIPGSRMPLANQPFTIPEMLAMFCLVERYPMDGDPSALSGPIDYKNCSYSADPENLNLLGDGVTWEGRISKILEFNCGGCHSEERAEGDLVLVGEGVYDKLLTASSQVPEFNLVEPTDAENSYLFMKLTGADGIDGAKMPFDPFTGEGSLTQAELADIETWIFLGAQRDG